MSPKTATKPRASPKPKPASSSTTWTTTTTTTTSTSTITEFAAKRPKSKPTAAKACSSAQDVSKPKAEPKPKATRKPKAEPKKTKTEPSQHVKKPAKKEVPAAPTPATRPRSVHDALFAAGLGLDAVVTPNWRTTQARTDRLWASVPPSASGSPRLTFLDGTTAHRALATSLTPRLASNPVTPKGISAAFSKTSLQAADGLLPAASTLLGTPNLWKAGPTSNRAWAHGTLSHCLIFADASLEACGGTPGGLLQATEAALAAFVRAVQYGGKVGSDMRTKTGLRIWVRKGKPEAEAEGGVVHMGLQLFYAMTTRGWRTAILTDNKSFATVHFDRADVLLVSPAVSVVAPTGLSLFGAMVELLLADGEAGAVGAASGSKAVVKKEPKRTAAVKKEVKPTINAPKTEPRPTHARLPYDEDPFEFEPADHYPPYGWVPDDLDNMSHAQPQRTWNEMDDYDYGMNYDSEYQSDYDARHEPPIYNSDFASRYDEEEYARCFGDEYDHARWDRGSSL